MPTPIVIPPVGESVTSGVIAAWRKKTGEYAERDDVLLDLETDKITMEVRAPVAGVVETNAKEGGTGDIGAGGGGVGETASPAAPAAGGQGRAGKARPANAGAPPPGAS